MIHLTLTVALALSATPAAKKAPAKPPAADACVACHQGTSPNIVADWKASRHAALGVGCTECHGADHTKKDDASRAKLPTPDTCARCHEAQVAGFKKGKHALAWAAVKAMPTFHYQALAVREGLKGCGGCHKLGLKTEAEAKELKETSGGYGVASCDACHTRHLFSKAEARQPEACKTCHMGFDHPQWEMYDSSKHGVRNELKRTKTIPADAAAPTCQTCHMQEGNHEVRTAWGFLAVRLPMPEGDKQWTDDRVTILQGLGVLDPSGKPTARLDVVKAADVARLTQEAFDKERTKTLETCTKCHGAFPDLLTFHDAPTPIEQKLFVMFLEHRMRTFQGAFHASPDYVTWYGWSEMQRDLAEIRSMAEELRRAKKIDARLEAAASAKK